MEFKGRYLNALREKDPGLFMELRRSGQLDQFVRERGLEAEKMLKDLLAAKGSDPASRVSAEEQVMSVFLDMPVPERAQNPEPPDDLPRTPASKAKTSRLVPAR